MGFNKPDQAALKQYRDEAQSKSLHWSIILLPPIMSYPSSPSASTLPLATLTRQRNTTSTGLRTAMKSETVPTSQVSRLDGTTPSRSLSPTTRSLVIWTIGPSRGLGKRRFPREPGSGNMDSRRVFRLVRRLVGLRPFFR